MKFENILKDFHEILKYPKRFSWNFKIS